MGLGHRTYTSEGRRRRNYELVELGTVSVQNVHSSHPPSRNAKIKMYDIIILPPAFVWV
jgi:hypothetical protein